MNTIHQAKINELVNSGLAKVVSFTITEQQLRNEYNRIQNSYRGNYRTRYIKKNVAQLIVRRNIARDYPGWCEIRFNAYCSDIWFNGDEVTVVIKRKYQRNPSFPMAYTNRFTGW